MRKSTTKTSDIDRGMSHLAVVFEETLLELTITLAKSFFSLANVICFSLKEGRKEGGIYAKKIPVRIKYLCVGHLVSAVLACE